MAKYLKVNSKKGYIEDTAAIAHEKFNKMRHVVLGCMLGDFDNNGEYFVSPDIVAELIKMDKHIIESIDNIDICESFLRLDKPITFAITFQNDKATLSLLEKMNHGANFKLNSGAYSDINEYVLAEVETSGAVDKNAVYRMWNVLMGGGSALDVFHMDPETLAKFAGVVRRFKYLLAANKKLLKKEEKIEEIESAYFNKMMKVLARYPKLKVAVEKEIKNQLDEKTGMFRLDKPNAMKTMNEIIADAIEDNLEVLTEEEQKNFNVEKHNVENEYNIEITKEVDIKTEKIEQKDVNADPIVVPVIETFGEEDRKSIEELAKEFVEEEKKVEERVQDDIVTLATGKVQEKKSEKNEQKEESKNLILESIKADEKSVEEVKKDDTKEKTTSIFQEAVLAEIDNNKNGSKRKKGEESVVKSEKLEAVKGLIAIATETEKEKVVITDKGVATVTETEKKLVVAEVEDGKVKNALKVSQKKTGAFIKSATGKEVAVKIEEVNATAVTKVDEATNNNTEEKTTKINKDNNLVANAGRNTQNNNARNNTRTSGSGGGGTPNKKDKKDKVNEPVAKTDENTPFGDTSPITPKTPKHKQREVLDLDMDYKVDVTVQETNIGQNTVIDKNALLNPEDKKGESNNVLIKNDLLAVQGQDEKPLAVEREGSEMRSENQINNDYEHVENTFGSGNN